ncbi:hypothetical protein H257_02344 [Aphanomyces astaci]|uniref:Uncharacterized protein n=1 Tax=Aphanomyces astaci TaxID=112090 RepID=W4H2E1_APHAT|nr:hypothetical protein H257_02344 [Aphanomyces astaci]ETV85761.1 hypothetical protein H257_02344 [Aphanomyces astaci]|eukprot:XP_009824233.1 hypothetical protein H257_02344 [Aphanomyces astaci]
MQPMAKHIKQLHPLATTSPETRLLALAITVSKTMYDGAVCSNHGQKGHLHADQDLDQTTVGDPRAISPNTSTRDCCQQIHRRK